MFLLYNAIQDYNQIMPLCVLNVGFKNQQIRKVKLKCPLFQLENQADTFLANGDSTSLQPTRTTHWYFYRACTFRLVDSCCRSPSSYTKTDKTSHPRPQVRHGRAASFAVEDRKLVLRFWSHVHTDKGLPDLKSVCKLVKILFK